jgi:DTW domain-containing protein YfiP
VPDGNWRQTSKMRRRDPIMADLPCVRLPPGPPSAYRVRKETKAEGLATIEAIARTLGILEGPTVQKALEDLLDLMVTRTLASRGIGS